MFQPTIDLDSLQDILRVEQKCCCLFCRFSVNFTGRINSLINLSQYFTNDLTASILGYHKTRNTERRNREHHRNNGTRNTRKTMEQWNTREMVEQYQNNGTPLEL